MKKILILAFFMLVFIGEEGVAADMSATGERVHFLDEQARIVIEDFGPETVDYLIDEVYAKNITFQDPLEIHHGRDDVLAYLKNVY